MRSRQIRDAADARQVINGLFGLTPEWIGLALDELGAEALTERALLLIAEAQIDEEFRRADAVAGEDAQ